MYEDINSSLENAVKGSWNRQCFTREVNWISWTDSNLTKRFDVLLNLLKDTRSAKSFLTGQASLNFRFDLFIVDEV